jgi:two-component system response regulator NreC
MPRILIADDHEGTRAILRVLLQGQPGWEVCGEAGTGSEALEKAVELRPDVILKDWVMPGMDNLEFSRKISKALPRTSIVVFSFYDLPELIVAAKAAGVHGFASKDVSALIGAIREVLNHSPAGMVGAVDPLEKNASEYPEDVD